MEAYRGTALQEDLVVEELLTVHYFEYSSDYFFPGEAHNFWEFLYVDKGEVAVTAGTETFVIKKGEIIFHKPMEFHNLWANGTVAPNLVVIAFRSSSPAMDYFENRVLKVGDREKELMAQIVREARTAFSSALDDPNLRFLRRRDHVPFGSEQIIKISLEIMLLYLVRDGMASTSHLSMRPSSSIKERNEHELYQRIIGYLEENLQNRLTLDEVCRDNIVGRSYLQKIFREKSGGGVMDYFGKLKIESAKQAIRQNTNNFTEISRTLGYTSIHYFSRHFKKVTGMTPSEYASSVKIMSEAGPDERTEESDSEGVLY